jgi:hypothetical protein
MKKNNGQVSRRRHGIDYAIAAMEQMELYCDAHPGSPAAVRRPRLFVRGELWIALLGPSVEEGIVGIGPTVTSALRAFELQYLAGLRPAAELIDDSRTVRSASSATVRSHTEKCSARCQISLSQRLPHRRANQV